MPLNDPICCVKVTGKIIRDLAENGVSKWPSYEGRWCTFSGLKFKFDPTKPSGNRILDETFRTDKGEVIEMNKTYTLAVIKFLLSG